MPWIAIVRLRILQGFMLLITGLVAGHGPAARASGTPAGTGSATEADAWPPALQELCIPSAMLRVAVDLRKARAAPPLQALWRTLTLLEPDTLPQLDRLGTALGASLERDIGAVVLSFGETGGAIGLTGRFDAAAIVARARAEGWSLEQDGAAPVPLFVATAPAATATGPLTDGPGVPMALAFPASGLVLGAAPAVRSIPAHTAAGSKAAPAPDGHLLHVSMNGLQQLQKSRAPAAASTPSTPAHQALGKLDALSLTLDAPGGLKLALDLQFLDPGSAAAAEAEVFQKLLLPACTEAIQRALARSSPEHELCQQVKFRRDGRHLLLSLEFPEKLTALLVRSLQREASAQATLHPESGLTLTLPLQPSAWTLQPAQAGNPSFFGTTLDGQMAAMSASRQELGQNSWRPLADLVAWQKQNLGAHRLISSTLSSIGATEVHLLVTEMGGLRYQTVQFLQNGAFYGLGAWSPPAAAERLQEELQFVAGRLLAPPLQASGARQSASSHGTSGRTPGGAPETPAEALLRLQDEAQQQSFTFMSNLLRMQHETSMAIIHNMGSGYTIEYRYEPVP